MSTEHLILRFLLRFKSVCYLMLLNFFETVSICDGFSLRMLHIRRFSAIKKFGKRKEKKANIAQLVKTNDRYSHRSHARMGRRRN